MAGEDDTGRDLLAGAGGFNRLVRGREGHVLYNRHDSYVGRSIERYGEYSHGESLIFGQLVQPGMIAAEVGANIGAETLVLARLVGQAGRVVAYEPQRVVFQTLCANVALNGLTNVECHWAAVGAEEGTLLIPEIDYGREGNFGGLEIRGFEDGRPVPVRTLDRDFGATRLDFLKIDVEGMEAEVIRGAGTVLRRNRPLLYVENDRPNLSAPLIEALFALDYRLWWHPPRLFNPDNFFGEAEDVFPRLVSMNMVGIPKSIHVAANGLTEILDAAEHPWRDRLA